MRKSNIKVELRKGKVFIYTKTIGVFFKSKKKKVHLLSNGCTQFTIGRLCKCGPSYNIHIKDEHMTCTELEQVSAFMVGLRDGRVSISERVHALVYAQKKAKKK